MKGFRRVAAHQTGANQSCAIALALCVAVCGVVSRASGPTLAIQARSLAPGEVLVLTVTVGAEPRRVHISLFGKDVSASRLPDGRWEAVAGIDLEQAPGAYTATVTATTESGTASHQQAVIVGPKEFLTRRLRVNPAFVSPSPPQLAQIKEDSAFLKTIFAASVSTRLWSSPFVRPVPGEVGSSFGSRSIFNGELRRPHSGADFRSPAGTPIKAPNAGRIVCARDLYFTGQTVIVDHGVGIFSTLAHLSRLDVKEGAMVAAGEVVGLVGSTGRATAPHLHWGVSVAGARVDPMSVLELLGTKD